MATFDINWNSGDTSYLELFYNDVDGNPIDLTDATIEMDLKLKRTDCNPVLPTKFAAWDNTTNQILFKYFPYETTEILKEGKTKMTFYYDVQITTLGGEVTTILSGKVFLNRTITNQL